MVASVPLLKLIPGLGNQVRWTRLTRVILTPGAGQAQLQVLKGHMETSNNVCCCHQGHDARALNFTLDFKGCTMASCPQETSRKLPE